MEADKGKKQKKKDKQKNGKHKKVSKKRNGSDSDGCRAEVTIPAFVSGSQGGQRGGIVEEEWDAGATGWASFDNDDVATTGEAATADESHESQSNGWAAWVDPALQGEQTNGNGIDMLSFEDSEANPSKWVPYATPTSANTESRQVS